MTRISAVICCANAADTIAQACQSVRWAHEVVVVDSGSSDDTTRIAGQFADRLAFEPWRGHTRQKKFATDLARNDWVLILDSDEVCSPQLAQELQSMADQDLDCLDLLMVPRRNYVMGKPVRAWWPDYLTRVFHRHRCTWDDQVLHDRRMPSHPSRVKKLCGWIEHKKHSQAGFSDYFSGQRMDDRLLMVARQMYEKGRRCHWWDLVLRPRLAFWKSYLIKRGVLDGTFGLLIAQKSAVSTQLKYAALWTVQEDLDRGRQPASAGPPQPTTTLAPQHPQTTITAPTQQPLIS